MLAGLVFASNAQADETQPSDINQRFMTSEPDALDFLESESREVFAQRAAIVDALKLSAGQRVADVGAGTGAHLWELAKRVGPKGRVFAVDVAPKLVEHLRAQAQAKRLSQVEVILAPQDDTGLPEASVDLVFTCDTYHHFEDPAAATRSIRRALVKGGRFVIVDFIRKESVSKSWVLEHVRAGKDVVVREVEAAGFELVEEPTVAGLKDNYMLVFQAK